MAGHIGSEITAEPNLTPMLDVVFQLITFFMLVFRISGESFDQRIKLPVAGSARPIEGDQVLRDRLVLNIDADGNLIWNGEPLDYERAVKELRTQAAVVRLNLRVSGQKTEPGDPLPTIIVVRGDGRTPFAELYRYITACQVNGFTKFDLKAMTGE